MFKNMLLNAFARSRILFSKIITVSLILVFIFSDYIWANKAFSGWINLVLQSSGLILIVICVLGRLWSAVYLCGNKNHTLITEGPYGMVRNPLYFFSFIGVIGVGLTAGSIVGLLLITTMFIFYYLPTIIDEEKRLEKIHKEEFTNYMAKVPRLIPNFSLLAEPDLYTLKPHSFRKTFFDVAWFFWVYLILVFIERLHDFGVLPAIFKII